MKNKRRFLISILIFCFCLISLIIINLKSQNNINTTEQNADYKIPKVYFEGNIENMNTKKDERKIIIKYESNEQNFKTFAKIKIQGTSSLNYEKKNYTINLYKDKFYQEKNPIDVKWGEQSKYCLKANWIDKTHARNIITAQIASDIQKKYNVLNDTPNNGVIDGYPVEIYINGKFLGLYTWNIPKDAWMFNMNENENNNIVFSNEDWYDANLFKDKATYDTYSIETGKENNKSLKKLNRLITFIKDSNDEEFKSNIEEYINLDAAINYFIIAEVAQLIDNVAKNMLLITYDGNVWYPTLYDLDTSWGTMYDGLSTLDYNVNTSMEASELWYKLEKNYKKEIAIRYFELRKSILTKENIMKKFNEFQKLIPEESFEKEIAQWKNIPGYDYKQIEEFLNIRLPLIDKIMTERLK